MAIYYGTKESVNLIYGYTSNILQWSPVHVIYLGLASVAGIVIFMIIMAQLLARKKITVPGLFILGFSMLLLYQLWVYFIFTPDLSYQDLMLPIFFQGASSGVLFVPIMLMMLVSVGWSMVIMRGRFPLRTGEWAAGSRDCAARRRSSGAVVGREARRRSCSRTAPADRPPGEVLRRCAAPRFRA